MLLDGGLLDHAPHPATPIRNDDDEHREAARADVRIFGIFLDDYHVSREASLQTRDVLARFIANDLGPSDLIAVMTPRTPLSTVVLTRNHDGVEKELEALLGRKGEYSPPVGPAEENVVREFGDRPAEVEKIRNRVTYSALDAFIAQLGGYRDTRKTLILVTEGFAGGLRDSPGHRGGMYAGTLYSDANRGNVSIYWIDPRRLGALAPAKGEWVWDDRTDTLQWRPGPVSLRSMRSQQDPLKALSLYTDGRAIVNRNDLAAAMKDIVRDMSGYYLLGYNSTLDATDGKCHEITVRVNRPGLSDRARKGYWAYSKTEVAEATAPPTPEPPADVKASLNALAQIEHAGAFRTWIGFERGAQGKTSVLVSGYDHTLQSAGAAHLNDSPEGIELSARTAEGTALFAGHLSDIAVFEAAPGEVSLRMTARSDASPSATETEEIIVPALDDGHPAFGTPKFVWSRSAAAIGQSSARVAQANAPVTAARTFSRADHVLIRVPAYGVEDVTAQQRCTRSSVR